MRQFYITCLALSSFFIHSSSPAWAQFNQHAFFVPGNVFQENTTLQEIKNNNNKDSSPTTINVKEPSKDPLATTVNHPKKIKRTLPYVKKIPTPVSPKNFNNFPQDDTSLTDTSTTSKYTLGDDLDTTKQPKANTQKSIQKQLSDLDLYSHKSVEEMLEDRPYPNKSLPKFKQRVALYDVELRNLYHRGTLPFNQEQEDTLSKASSAKYFFVP